MENEGGMASGRKKGEEEVREDKGGQRRRGTEAG